MNRSITPRISGINDEHVRSALDVWREQIRKGTLALLSDSLGPQQIRFAGLRSGYASCASHLFVLGYPLDLSQRCFGASALAAKRMFELRGTATPFFVLNVTIDQQYLPGDPRAVVSAKPRNPPDAKDFSLTNSRDNIEGVAAALSSGWTDGAREIAAMAWDPPDARYIGDGPNAACTKNEQRMAYALRDYFAGDLESARRSLGQLRALPRQLDVWGLAGMLRGLIDCSAETFLQGITDYLTWFERKARHKYHQSDPAFFLAKIPLGLSVLACERQLLSPDAFALDNPRFPVELVRLTLQNPIRSMTEFPIVEVPE